MLVAGPAAAEKETFPLDCGSAGKFVVESNGNGEFTSARDVNSNRVLVPVAFGEFTGMVTDLSGNVVPELSRIEPASTKGSGKQKSNATCTFSFSFVSDGSDPDFPPAGFTFTGTGTVDVKITPGGPRRR